MSDERGGLDAGLFMVGDVTQLKLMIEAGKVLYQAWYQFGPETTYKDWEAVIAALCKEGNIPVEVTHLPRKEVSFACRPERAPTKDEVERACAELEVRKLMNMPMQTVEQAASASQSVHRLILP